MLSAPEDMGKPWLFSLTSIRDNGNLLCPEGLTWRQFLE